MKTLIFASVLLSGCASTCREACVLGFGPGSASFDAIAKYHNEQDPCQYIGKPEGYKVPSWCYSNQGKTVYHIKDMNGLTIYKVQ